MTMTMMFRAVTAECHAAVRTSQQKEDCMLQDLTAILSDSIGRLPILILTAGDEF